VLVAAAGMGDGSQDEVQVRAVQTRYDVAQDHGHVLDQGRAFGQDKPNSIETTGSRT
jgi:hypothetical protein